MNQRIPFSITVPTRKPRNPWVAAGRLRRAGAHRAEVGAVRQHAQRQLLRELDRLRSTDP